MKMHRRLPSPAHSLRAALTAAALALLPGCDSATTGGSNPIEGVWEVTLREGVTLPDRQTFNDPYSSITYIETRGELSMFDDMTGYLDIIDERVYDDQAEPDFDYQVWNARVLEVDGDALTLRLNRRDDIRFLDCVLGSSGDRLTCTDPEREPPDDPAAPDPSAWEFMLTSA